jgi:indoleamine 2,3-dioxygenase
LDIPPVATYASTVLWNHKPLFLDEPIDRLENLSTLITFTGSLDESWFYLVSVAIEARGAPTIPLMLKAIEAARDGDRITVRNCLDLFAERLDEICRLLERMYDSCDPHVFYHRIRPFLAGSKNMAEAGLPNGVWYDVGDGNVTYQTLSGGSNAQSSLIQFFDIVLGVEHRPTGEKKPTDTSESEDSAPQQPKSKHNFIEKMREYMPGNHARFLSHVASIANIREFVNDHRSDSALALSYDACLAMLRALRDKHIQIVTRYIISKARESRAHERSISPRAAPHAVPPPTKTGLEWLPFQTAKKEVKQEQKPNKPLRGTGGSALISFLKQARDETSEGAVVDGWLRRLAQNDHKRWEERLSHLETDKHEVEGVGLAGTWTWNMEVGGEGGLCHW